MRRTFLSAASLAVLAFLAASPRPLAEETEPGGERPAAAPAGKPAAPAARLAVTRDGLLLLVEGSPIERFASLTDLVRAHPGLAGEFTIESASADPAPSPEAGAVPAPGRPARVKIAAGTIPAADFLRYLADASGLPVIYAGADRPLGDRTIESASEPLVRQILQANGLRVSESATGAEGRVLRVEPAGAPPPLEPQPVPIVRVAADGEPEAGTGPPSTRRRARGPEAGPREQAGVVLEEVPEVLQSQLALALGEGVFVASIDPAQARSSRALALLERFDVVTHVDIERVSSPAKLVEAINAIAARQPFQLRVVRGGVTTILNGVK